MIRLFKKTAVLLGLISEWNINDMFIEDGSTIRFNINSRMSLF